MPRRPRSDPPGAVQHVMNHGCPVLTEARLRARFLAQLAHFEVNHGLQVYAFALLSDRYHLVLRSVDGQLSNGIQSLQSNCTRAARRAGLAEGPLFRARFKSRVVLSEAYQRHLVAWLHLSAPSTSSHSAYIGTPDRPTWLRVDRLLASFGGPQGYSLYLQGLRSGAEPGPPEFDTERLWGAPVEEGGGPLRRRAPREALLQVAGVTGVPLEQVLTRCRGRGGNPPRLLAAWWLNIAAGLTCQQVADELGFTVGAAAKALHDARQRIQTDVDFRAWAHHLVRS